ncbi:Rpn family recombination-promoting nuclease/putative transposase [Klebsiella quasipneumoniae]|uniref:Rpn family recombination-promoting nuclease/putative transposase n=1 Tax=Klebsiella quasipneumoniae TaxID=1463165 RepID=UPI002FE37BD0|nr:Rpn family recombination-promoting nuclease/putative transposase [Klebsiella quasipneumoniae]
MKKRPHSTPHDSLFKRFLRDSETARDFLDIHLPPALRHLCDLSTLHLESGSFVEDNLRASYSDILYSLQTSKGEGYIYVVIEHQSTPDSHMAFRLLRYALAAMQQHLDRGHKALPLVIPMLFYHGSISPYPFSLCWLDEFPPDSPAKQLYLGAFPLVDVTDIPDDAILQHRRIALLELVQKHIRQRDLSHILQQLVEVVLMGYTDHQQFKTLFTYMSLHGNSADPDNFIDQLVERLPQYEDTLMTIAEYLKQKGREEGKQRWLQQGQQEGLQEGLQAGEHREACRIALMMLENGMDTETVLRMTRLSADELATLARQARQSPPPLSP